VEARVSAVALHAALVVAALAVAWVVPGRTSKAVGLAAFVAAHWVWALSSHAHALVFVGAVPFWLPVVRGRAGPAYVLAGIVASDTAALWLAATGHSEQSVALLGGMLPVAVAFVVVAWKRLREEEAGARAAA
jgi:hypothetical protein